MRPTNAYRIAKVKRLIELIAYGSLALDFAISIVTLITINTGSQSLLSVQWVLNVALSGVIVMTTILFLTVVFLTHYDKLLYHFGQTGISVRYRPKK
ncbi:MAG: hypothetical protein KGH49_02130 [Candidatus Micrarchaeota archaeon]|nr:hypothetical protein [Candidatus Micrarchaeota archaeon]